MRRVFEESGYEQNEAHFAFASNTMKSMNLYQYMLLPFGLSLRYKSLDNIFTGISITNILIIIISILLSLTIHISMNYILIK